MLNMACKRQICPWA